MTACESEWHEPGCPSCGRSSLDIRRMGAGRAVQDDGLPSPDALSAALEFCENDREDDDLTNLFMDGNFDEAAERILTRLRAAPPLHEDTTRIPPE